MLPEGPASLDKAYIWHPFTQMSEWLGAEPLVIESGEGCELIDSEGRRYIDGVSSLWVNIHGHRVRQIDAAIRRQLDRIAHSSLLGLAGRPSIELAQKLIALAPKGPEAPGPDGAEARTLSKVFYSESGASAVEVALKMAFGYWQHRSMPNKKTFVGFENGYHGDTLGAVAVGGIDLFHAAYRPLLFPALRASSPYCYRCPLGLTHPGCDIACLDSLRGILEAHHDEICAVIIEPLVQGAGGIITAPAGHLRRVRDLCDEFEVLMIADEVATGVGRTGTFWACEQENVVPDILAAGKGLTGGYLPLSVTITTDEIFEAFLGPYDQFKTFFHGHSYSGNALASAAALASLDLIESAGLLEHVKSLEPVFQNGLETIALHRHVGEVRRTGLMCGIEMVQDPATRTGYPPGLRIGHKIAMAARDHGAIIRPLGDVVVLMPPPAIGADQLTTLLEATSKAIDEVTG